MNEWIKKIDNTHTHTHTHTHIMGFCDGSDHKQFACRRLWFNPWIGKIPWRREWLRISVFLPGEFHGQRKWWATVHEVRKSQT